MALDIEKILLKGLDDDIPVSIADCALRFTTDTKRLFIEDGTSRIEITDIITSMTESQIINASSLMAKIYVASDTLEMYVSDGTDLEKVNKFVPVAISDNQNYYPVMRSADGTQVKGYNTNFAYNPSSKTFTVGGMTVTQTSVTVGNTTTTTILFD